MTRRTLPRGLFALEESHVSIDSAQAMRAELRRIDAAAPLESNIAAIDEAAREVLRASGFYDNDDPLLHKTLDANAERAHETLSYLEAMKAARRDGHVDEALHNAMKATEHWMMLRANLAFEKPVREKEKRADAAFTVTDDQVIYAVATYGTLNAAAAALGLSTRQLRTRRTSIRKRKS